MSTEHPSTPLGAGDADLEYGPTPPDAKHEHTDINVQVGYKFALWLAAAVMISAAIVYGTFWVFEGRARTAGAAAQQYPLAAQPLPGSGERVERPMPTPALQTEPFRDINQLRAGETDKLHTYGWVDKEGGVTRVPIDRAMEVVLQRGLPVRPDAPAGTMNVTQDSSSGRTVAPR